ncbi:DD-heptose 17-bisphosphate phosphatase protein [Marine Group I thaumarchaeote SCGC AAA799-B03]|uniref:D,D-heptose 1,7-bisphosphate phosphatase n=1 Tax=Marine Group I thaumarchaeote SCGC AAA799-B03 TaxID=1502289 RepID=A0A087S8U3_9ARCH|nr:DD-heptose 17-bisphosphate phosphatase protein [Marine Group I thaumarchaeote SCGC AAA799-B03]
MNKAVFLDRDGVINRRRSDYVKSLDELEIFPSVQEGISKLRKSGFLVIVITNQSVINRGIINLEKLNEIHSKIQKKLREKDTKIDKFYFCPHRPDEKCDCRKPKSGLIIQAINDFSINPSESWMIGDSLTDIQAGENAGCNTLLVKEQDAFEKIVDAIQSSNNEGQTSK